MFPHQRHRNIERRHVRRTAINLFHDTSLHPLLRPDTSDTVRPRPAGLFVKQLEELWLEGGFFRIVAVAVRLVHTTRSWPSSVPRAQSSLLLPAERHSWACPPVSIVKGATEGMGTLGIDALLSCCRVFSCIVVCCRFLCARKISLNQFSGPEKSNSNHVNT